MKYRLAYVLLFFWSVIILAACCTKKFCLSPSPGDIHLAFRGFTGSGADSLYLNEYDKNGGLLLTTTPITQPTLDLGTYDRYADSFYLNQRFFIITYPLHSDTINNINYQQYTYTINCNNCPGEKDVIWGIRNYTFNYNGVSHPQTDTIVINR